MSPFHPYVPPFARRRAAMGSALVPDLTPGLHGALFVADIAGFTALTERKARSGQAGIEEMQAILNRCFEPIVSIIEEGGGELYAAILGGVQGRWEAVLGGDALTQVAEAEAVAPGQVVLSRQAFEMIQADCNGTAQ